MQQNLFELNPDLDSLIENIQMGPQAQVLELIDNFNNSYIRTPNHVNRSYNLQAPTKFLGITKRFYWKPGAYDTIKDIIWYQSELHKKAASLYKVIDRAKSNGHWRLRNLSTDINAIERILINFRTQGLIMQDNTDDVTEAWEIIKAHLYEQYEKSDHRFHLNIIPKYLNDVIVNYYLEVIYKYDNIKINYQHHDSADNIAEILMPGFGHITIRFSLVKLINTLLITKNMDINNISQNHIISGRYNNRNWLYLIGGDWKSYNGIWHPYISNNYTSNGQSFSDNFRYVCIGNLEDEFRACIKSLDFISLQIFVDRVMTHYDTNTGPLNQLNRTYHGQPKFLENNDEFYRIIPKKSSATCSYRDELYQLNEEGVDIKKDSYCAEYCTLQDSCTMWIDVTKVVEPLTAEELSENNDRLALEHATLQLVNQRRG